MILVPAGAFIMGCDLEDHDANYDEHPQREIYLDAFYIDENPVTNADYKKFIDETGYKPPYLGLSWSRKYDWHNGVYPEGKENCPVVLVSWHDAVAYCQWMGKRLPTEAEWEKAARGTDGRIWPWGNKWDSQKLACHGVGDTQPVGKFKAGKSPYGCFDMAGNVWEWIADLYGSGYYQEAPVKNPQGPGVGVHHVLKGGAWIHSKLSVRCAKRFHKPPTHCDYYIGFRCAKSA
jgi:formylglycine-generating enzyme required for sulfatase activity